MRQQILAWLYSQRFVIGFAAWQLLSSGILTLPEPGTKFSGYGWLFDWSHQFLNTKAARKPPA